MSVTFSSLLSSLRLTLRDSAVLTWSDAQLGELANRGIETVGTVYPQEVIDSVAYTQGSIGVSFPITLTNVNWVSRVDIYDTSGKYCETVRPSSGDGPDSGWELHGSTLYLPPRYALSASTGTAKVVGYGDWSQISATFDTTGAAISPSTVTVALDNTALNAVKIYVEAECLTMLMYDRAQYQQWQVAHGASDISALGMSNIAMAAQQRWRQEKSRIRRLRKWG